jgi:hypothetical protein
MCTNNNCVWNPPAWVAVAPTTAVNTCTHKDSASMDEAQVNLCMSLTVADVCQQDGCVWNMPKTASYKCVTRPGMTTAAGAIDTTTGTAIADCESHYIYALCSSFDQCEW